MALITHWVERRRAHRRSALRQVNFNGFTTAAGNSGKEQEIIQRSVYYTLEHAAAKRRAKKQIINNVCREQRVINKMADERASVCCVYGREVIIIA